MGDGNAEIVKAVAQGTVEGAFASFNQLLTNLLGPVSEEIGIDWRNRYRTYVTARTARLLGRAQEGFDICHQQPHTVPPKLFKAVLENGSLEEDDSLQDRWAALLINAGPSGREQQLLLNSAPDILKQLNKWEIMLLEQCAEALEPEDYMPLPRPQIRSQLNTLHEWQRDLRNNHGFDRSGMRYTVDFGIMTQNLVRLRLLKTKEENGKEVDLFLTTLGYHFLLLCKYPKPWVPEAPRIILQRVYLVAWIFKETGKGDVHFDQRIAMSARGAATWDVPGQAAKYVQEIVEKCEALSTADRQYKINDPMIEQREDGKFVISFGMPVIDRSRRKKPRNGEAMRRSNDDLEP